MAKRIPNKLYGKWENEGTDDEFFMTSVSVKDLCISEEIATIGIYELTKTTKAVNKTEILRDKK